MINKKMVTIVLTVCMTIMGVAGCSKAGTEDDSVKKTKGIADEATIEGMYLTYGEDGYIFVDTQNKSLFHAAIPEGELYDENEKKIEQEDLNVGDMIACYGNGIVMESYPPQYAGITKMVRTQTGTEKDAEKYQALLEGFYQEPSPADIPYMDIENVQKDAIVTTAATQFGYSWSYEDENGERQGIEADACHVLQSEDLIDINCNGDNSDLKFMFTKKPESVKVTRWDQGMTMDDIDKGENVEVTLDGKTAFVKNAKKTSVYEVVATWKNGSVTYGFYIK